MKAAVTNEYNETDLIFWREHAPFYDLYSTGQDGDVAFYVEEAQRVASSVLEIGCGSGRVLIPVAQAGIPIVGLDRSETMLSIARQKVAELAPEVQQRIHLFAGDMLHLSLEKRFALVTIPYRGFQIDNLYGDFQRGLFRSGGQQVWVARKR